MLEHAVQSVIHHHHVVAVLAQSKTKGFSCRLTVLASSSASSSFLSMPPKKRVFDPDAKETTNKAPKTSPDKLASTTPVAVVKKKIRDNLKRYLTRTTIANTCAQWGVDIGGTGLKHAFATYWYCLSTAPQRV